MEASFEEDRDLKDTYWNKSLLELISIRETASKNFLDDEIIDHSRKEYNAHVDFNDKKPLKNI